MKTSFLFWLIMLLVLVFNVATSWPKSDAPFSWSKSGVSLLNFVLLGIIGWRVFGPPIQD